jgi:hypothetical protein
MERRLGLIYWRNRNSKEEMRKKFPGHSKIR